MPCFQFGCLVRIFFFFCAVWRGSSFLAEFSVRQLVSFFLSVIQIYAKTSVSARGKYTHCFWVKRVRPPLRAAAPAHATASASVISSSVSPRNFLISIGRRTLQSVVDCVGPRWRLAPTTTFSSSSAVCPASERCAFALPVNGERLLRVVRYCGRLHCVARP